MESLDIERNKTVKKLLIDSHNHLRILQFTDLHLCHRDTEDVTFTLISDLVKETTPNLVVLTGDLAMSKDSPLMYEALSKHMNSLRVPWTFVFGNHDTEHGVSHQQLVDALETSEYCLFEQGESDVDGCGNHLLEVHNDVHIVAQVILLDSHVDDFYLINEERKWGYGTILPSQVKWVESIIKDESGQFKQVPSIVFFHIPSPEFDAGEHTHFIDGVKRESNCYPPVEHGLFSLLAQSKTCKGIFVGHDHYNDYSMIKEGMLLAYGRVSGQYDYGMSPFPKGARVIDLFGQEIKSHIILWNPR